MARFAMAQGLYYVATGIWPLVDVRTFERVTGPKADDWLVKTVASASGTAAQRPAGRS